MPARAAAAKEHGSHLTDLIGNTPLIRLDRLSDETGCQILGKAEFMNPGGSVKDRTALGIIRAAEASGELQPGGTIIEGTAGNTGIGLTMLADALGYKTHIVMPMTQSREKIELLEVLGAELHLVPACSYQSDGHYVHTARRLAEERAAKGESCIWARQFDNTANRDIHMQTTGEEIWRQTSGEVHGFVCACGTGGTLAGVSRSLLAHNPDITIALSDPEGSALHSWVASGELAADGTSITEGIGIGHITKNLEDTKITTSFQIPDAEALPIIYALLREEGLCLGGSSAINLAGAVRLARELGPGHCIVTVLCDSGMRYQSKLYNTAFLHERGLPTPPWLENKCK